MRVDLPLDGMWPEPVLPPAPSGFWAWPVGTYRTDDMIVRRKLRALPQLVPRGVVIRDDPAPPFPAHYELRPTWTNDRPNV